MGFFQKRNLQQFLSYMAKYKQEEPSTHHGTSSRAPAIYITTDLFVKLLSNWL